MHMGVQPLVSLVHPILQNVCLLEILDVKQKQAEKDGTKRIQLGLREGQGEGKQDHKNKKQSLMIKRRK
jgi:hypothetical protein